MDSIKLRPFQERAVTDYRAAWKRSTSHLGIAPTAFGKTIFMGWLAGKLVPTERYRFVVLAHREALVAQNADKIRRCAPGLDVQIEQAAARATRGMGSSPLDVISASVQTLKGKRLEQCAKEWREDGRPIFLITDEAHHATAPSYDAIRMALLPARQLGLTATPFRPDDADGANLRMIYPELAFNIPRGEMIDDGWLAAPRHWLINTSVSLEGLKKTKGDYVEKELAERLDVEERNVQIMRVARDAAEVMRVEYGIQVVRGVCFCLSVAHAYTLAEAFAGMGWDARAISAETPIEDRRAADQALRTATRHTMLFSYGVLTEGWDVEEVNLGLFARPTKSGVLADQMLGRILRFHADKPAAFVVDFGDQGDEGRVSIASTFNLPRGWSGEGESLRADELWFREKLKGARYSVRHKLWQASLRADVEKALEGQDDAAAILPDRPMVWWDLGEEIRMIVNTMSVIVRQTEFGDFEARWAHGLRGEMIVRGASLSTVLERAEEWVNEHHPNEGYFLRLWPDTGRAASDRQLQVLRNMQVIGADEEPTMRQASILLNQQFMERARDVERGLVGFGKYKGVHITEVPTHYMRYALTDEKMATWMQEKNRPELAMFDDEIARRGARR